MEISNQFFPNNLLELYSPSLPKDFPKNIVKNVNICQLQFLELMKCTTRFGYGMQCPREYDKFLLCKKDRDIKLFQELKKWEIDKISNISDYEKSNYIIDLMKQKSNLETELEKMPFSFKYQNKRWRYEADLEQLEWRINYLKKKK